MNIESVGGSKTIISQSSQLSTRTVEGNPKNASFENLLKTTQTTQTEEQMTEMIDTIDRLKETLEFDMSVENLMAYKKALKSFVDYYTKHELNVQDVLMTDKKGNTKKLQIVKSIHEKLDNITTSMLETHLGHLQMLKDIDELQGMVVNLYL